MNLKPIGTRIQEIRKAKKLTQEQLAEMVDLSPSYISAVERGAKTPKLETLIELANTLGASADDLLGDVVNASIKSSASELSERIENLPKERQRVSLEIGRILTED